ncbi:hypothetical protein MXEN_21247 [Mycobacterium xenopi RIVM700367]|nr:hypothetical protein MXEN_21247 [Mycobacterium xenopi RIVM700367]
MAAPTVSPIGVEEVEMSPLLLACLSIGGPVAGLGLVELQARLERWDQERHAED